MEYIVRLGADIIIKSNRIRNRFVNRLVSNVRAACAAAGVSIEIEREWSRFFVRTETPETIDILRRIFGISSVSLIEHTCRAELEEIAALAKRHYQDKVAGKTFAVRAKRVGQHAFTSVDIARTAGAAMYEGSAGVRLKKPEVELYIEVREDEALFFSERSPGPGGLPIGVGGRALCLLSGGFDSAIAAWMLQKRGVELDYLFCNLAGESYEKSVLGLAKLLADQWSSGTAPKLFVLPMESVVKEIKTKVKPSHAQIILKRAFYRLADKVAQRNGSVAIVTGECLGQVSSQTLLNLRAIETVAELPVLRPLLGFDKDEIIAFSRRIGTYAISSGIEEYCQLVPDKPVTACSIESADRQEAFVDLSVLDEALTNIRRIDLKGLSPADLVLPYLYREALTVDDVLVDCRSEESFAAWHAPGAINIEFYDLLADPSQLKKEKSYVLYCPVGLQSAVLAEKLQNLGYKVHSFRGGIAALKQHLNL